MLYGLGILPTMLLFTSTGATLECKWCSNEPSDLVRSGIAELLVLRLCNGCLPAKHCCTGWTWFHRTLLQLTAVTQHLRPMDHLQAAPMHSGVQPEGISPSSTAAALQATRSAIRTWGLGTTSAALYSLHEHYSVQRNVLGASVMKQLFHHSRRAHGVVAAFAADGVTRTADARLPRRLLRAQLPFGSVVRPARAIVLLRPRDGPKGICQCWCNVASSRRKVDVCACLPCLYARVNRRPLAHPGWSLLLLRDLC
jgi:hypothetical protein